MSDSVTVAQTEVSVKNVCGRRGRRNTLQEKRRMRAERRK